jgi:hypothetical protein
MWKTWQERRSSGKRGKSDVNVALSTLMWQLRHTSSQTWQERRSSGKHGKNDVNMERPTLTWQERRQHGKRDVIGQHDFFFYKFPLFCENMDNFVRNAANKTSEFLQYVVVYQQWCIQAPNKDFFPEKRGSCLIPKTYFQSEFAGCIWPRVRESLILVGHLHLGCEILAVCSIHKVRTYFQAWKR